VGGISAEVLPFAVATAVSPLPLVALLVVLVTPRAVPNGLAFTAGWATALLAVGAGMVALISSGVAPDEQAGAVTALEAVVGLGLIAIAVQQWRRRPRAGTLAEVPGWLLLADRCTPLRAFVMGTVMILANPKNLTLTAAASDAVADSASTAGAQVPALVLFAVVGSLGLAVPLVLRVAVGARAVGTLTRWRRWLMLHGTPLGCLLVAAIGLVLVARAAVH
jgi:hypothetical protein